MKAVELEDIVKSSLEKQAPKVVLAAVSGGVDSMVMLSLLSKFSHVLSYDLQVITVNHNIRPEEETSGDAALVADYCRQLGVPCTVTELARNEVSETAQIRGGGIEEAARFLRYQAFERASDACGAGMVCIAHNRNDRLETILERFFQGARAGSAAGMKQSRDRYFRPLFDVPRSAIEAYASLNGIPFRTDVTNADNRYYRNRIRNELMPLLDSLIPGWDTAVLNGAEKNALIAAALEKHASSVVWQAADGAVCTEKADAADRSVTALQASAAAFYALEPAERLEALYRGLNALGTERRVPYKMLSSFAEGGGECGSGDGSNVWKADGAGIELLKKNGSIIIRKDREPEIDGFYVLIKECGTYSMPWGEIIIRADSKRVGKNAFYAENIKNGAISGLFTLPVVIRSRQPSDRIRDKNGGHKEVAKLFSEWHITERCEVLLPVFENAEVLGVWGGVFDYPDYFVIPAEENL